jgi:hypothetical protein
LSLCPFASGHCVVDLPTAYCPFGIFKHLLLVDIVMSIYPLLIAPLVSSNIYYKWTLCCRFTHCLLPLWYLQAFVTSGHCDVDLPTAYCPFGISKHLLLVAIVLWIYPDTNLFGIIQTFITNGHCLVNLPTANYRFGIFQTFITSDQCVGDLPTAIYRFGIFQTLITCGQCVVDLPTANYPFGICQRFIISSHFFSIYPLLITALVSFYN